MSWCLPPKLGHRTPCLSFPVKELRARFTALWRHYPNLTDRERQEKMREGIRIFDRIFDEWTEVRGKGTPGVLEATHAYRPEWENELVETGLSTFATDAMEKPYCYRESCDKSCAGATPHYSLLLHM